MGPLEYDTHITQCRVGELEFELLSIRNVEHAIDLMFAELEKRGATDLLDDLCPYFGTLWPAARQLSQWIWEHRTAFENRSVLEIGCGLALPSLVASRVGAQVVASDLHPDVPGFLERNLKQNPGTRVQFQCLDWREDGGEGRRYDWIIASDVLYERHHPETLARFLTKALSPTGRAVVVDPKRSFWEDLVLHADDAGLALYSQEEQPHGILLEFQHCQKTDTLSFRSTM